MRRNIVLTALLLLIGTAFSLSAQRITVDGVVVTASNASNVLAGGGDGKDGAVHFDANSNTLYLVDAKLDKGIEAIGLLEQLTIKVSGECQINASPFGLLTDSYVTITSHEGGKLHVVAAAASSGGFMMDGEEAILRFKDADVSFKKAGDSPAIASLLRSYGLLVFDHSSWYSDGGLVGAMRHIYIKRSRVRLPAVGQVAYRSPEGGGIPYAAIVDSKGQVNYDFFEVVPTNKYPITINDVVITEENASNVFPNSVIPDGYVIYKPEENRLIISNLDYFTMDSPCIKNFHDITDLPLTIEVRGYNTFWSGYNSGIYSRGPMVITGDGNLHVKTEDVKVGASGIFIADGQTLTLDKTRVYTTGYYGLVGGKANNAHLVVRDAYLEINCTNPTKGACMEGFQSMTLENVAIQYPEGAYFDQNYSGILLNNAQPAKEKVTIGNGEWQSVTSPIADEVGDATLIVRQEGSDLLVDLSGVSGRRLASVVTLSGETVARLATGVSHRITLPKGVYILVWGDFQQKVLIK